MVDAVNVVTSDAMHRTAGGLDGRSFLGPVDNFAQDAMTIVSADGLEVGVYRTAENAVAIRNLCPHRGAPVCKGRVRGTMVPSAPGQYRYDANKLVLVCPWHRWEFDLDTGKTAYDIDRLSLIRYAVIESQGGFYLGDRLPAGRSSVSRTTER